MELLDFRGKKITIGTTLKYLRTRTTGKADEIRFNKGDAWVKLDSTGLYYHSEYLMVIEPLQDENKRDKATAKDKIMHKISHSRKTHKEPASVISDYPDGPGYGGG